jgi:hypothetical protein
MKSSARGRALFNRRAAALARYRAGTAHRRHTGGRGWSRRPDAGRRRSSESRTSRPGAVCSDHTDNQCRVDPRGRRSARIGSRPSGDHCIPHEHGAARRHCSTRSMTVTGRTRLNVKRSRTTLCCLISCSYGRPTRRSATESWSRTPRRSTITRGAREGFVQSGSLLTSLTLRASRSARRNDAQF